MDRSKLLLLPVSALLLLATGACQTLPGKGHYEPHDARIVGTWMVVGPDFSWDDFPLDRGEKSYFADGTACGYIFEVNPDGEPEFSVFRDRWEIVDGQIRSTVVETNDPYLHAGEVIVDDIVSVDAHVLRMHETDEPAGTSYPRYRAPVDEGDRLCKLFDAVTGGRRD